LIPFAAGRAGKAYGAGIKGRRNADCLWNLLGVSPPVGQLIFARRLARTYAVSGPVAHISLLLGYVGFSTDDRRFAIFKRRSRKACPELVEGCC